MIVPIPRRVLPIRPKQQDRVFSLLTQKTESCENLDFLGNDDMLLEIFGPNFITMGREQKVS